MSAAPPSLARFFDAVVPVLRGDARAASLRDLDADLSARDERRLDMQRGMIRASRRRLLESAYAATGEACALEGVELSLLVDEHLRDEAGAEPDYASIALGFAARFEGRAPGWVVEVADWEECLHRLRVVGAPPIDPGFGAPVIVRAYSFDAPRWTKAARGGLVSRPTPAPTPVLAFRDEREVRRLTAGPGHVAAVALTRGDATRAELVAAVGDETLTSAHRELVQLGLLEGRP